MAEFIGYLEGSRGEASRLGSSSSGIRAQAQTWNEGVTVLGSVTRDAHHVDFELVANGGSNNNSQRRIGRLRYYRVNGSSRLFLDDSIISELLVHQLDLRHRPAQAVAELLLGGIEVRSGS